MKLLRICFLLLLIPMTGGCVSEPVVYDEARQAAVAEALALFRAEDELQPYFRDALAYAVFPANWRAGSGFGGAFGSGWLFEGEALTGRVIMTEVFVGPNLGVQADRKILFFRSEQALDQFRRGRFEFTGQANASVATAGRALTPGFNPDVAMFVLVRGGLLLEASVGTQRYDYFPLAE